MAKDKRLHPKNLFSFLSYESKLLIFSIFTVTIFACPILNVSITGNELSEDVNWNAPSAETNDTEWIIREGEFDYSGKLYEEGDEEGGNEEGNQDGIEIEEIDEEQRENGEEE